MSRLVDWIAAEALLVTVLQQPSQACCLCYQAPSHTGSAQAADPLCHCQPALQMYNVTNLFEDIKALYKIAGFKGQPVCFLFTDAEVKDEAFLEYINQILMTGEVAGQ